MAATRARTLGKRPSPPAARKKSTRGPKAKEWVKSLKALADESRLKIVAALLDGTASVNELADALGISQYNVSKHLRVLRDAGIIDANVNANRREHFITPPFRRKITQARVLDLGCCSFRFDKLPK